MSIDDPFDFSDDSDKTLIRPMPGGSRRRSEPPAPPGPGAVPPPLDQPAPVRAPRSATPLQFGSGINPLVTAATPLLSLAVQLRNTLSHPDVAGLRTHVASQVKAFDAEARNLRIKQEVVKAARYALCSLVDEVVLNTPWGSKSIWSKESLLIMFHKEAWGGEKFFHILGRVAQEPGANLDLLELLYLCICLGFEGKYRVQEQGSSKLEILRENVYNIINRHRGDYERELSPRWRGLEDHRNALMRYVPLWVVATVAAALLMALFLGYSYLINRASDPGFKELYAIGREKPPEPPPTAPVVVDRTGETLEGFLQPEIEQGLVEVVIRPDEALVRIKHLTLFASGSDRINPEAMFILERIAKALDEVEGDVVVAGHTDNVPIFTARFPSNWHLSMARATAVADVLKARVNGSRSIEPEGRADNEPLAPNDTPQNRARNRRVEVILIKKLRIRSFEEPSRQES